jgi:transcriptional regulator with XRE-family HTH domain
VPPEEDHDATDADVRFGEALRRALESSGLTAAQMAERLLVTERSVRRYTSAHRRPNESIVSTWERACGLEPGALTNLYERLPARGPSSQQAPLAPAASVDEGVPGTTTSADPARWPDGRSAVLMACAIGLLIALSGSCLWAQLGLTPAPRVDQPAAPSFAERARPQPPSRDYARALTGILEALNAERVDGRLVLVTAPTAREQGRAATRLTKAYARAVRAASRLRIAPLDAAADMRVVEAMRAAATGYAAMARAARRRRSVRFRSAAAEVRRAERRLLVALATLRRR